MEGSISPADCIFGVAPAGHQDFVESSHSIANFEFSHTFADLVYVSSVVVALIHSRFIW